MSLNESEWECQLFILEHNCRFSSGTHKQSSRLSHQTQKHVLTAAPQSLHLQTAGGGGQLHRGGGGKSPTWVWSMMERRNTKPCRRTTHRLKLGFISELNSGIHQPTPSVRPGFTFSGLETAAHPRKPLQDSRRLTVFFWLEYCIVYLANSVGKLSWGYWSFDGVVTSDTTDPVSIKNLNLYRIYVQDVK